MKGGRGGRGRQKKEREGRRWKRDDYLGNKVLTMVVVDGPDH